MPHRLTLAKMSELIRSRKLSSVELVDAHLKQIEAHSQSLNSFVMTFPSEARGLALQADGETPAKILHGIPITVKDSFDIADLPTLCGSNFRLTHRASSDSAAVARLKAAGAIILGKTNCPEFLANYETDNCITGRTNNPWNVDRTPGGSSGGEAAAIAAFCTAGGIGSDGGGSIRIPAHFCGIAGLKPTPGRISAVGHFPEISHPGGLLGVAGPMARNAFDLRILFRVLAGYDSQDPFSAPVPLREVDLTGLRIGVIEDLAGVPVQSEIKNAVQSAADMATHIGFAVEPFRPEGLERAHALWWFFFAETSAPFTRHLLGERRQDAHWTGTEFLDMVPDTLITGSQVIENLGARDRMRSHLLRQMDQFPVLLLPPCGVPAFLHNERTWDTPSGSIDLMKAVSQATPFNLLGLPAVVIPFGMTAAGLPIGVQLVGRPYEEEILLEIAIKLEEARGSFPAPPGFLQ